MGRFIVFYRQLLNRGTGYRADFEGRKQEEVYHRDRSMVNKLEIVQ